jgi:hypothetical protein
MSALFLSALLAASTPTAAQLAPADDPAKPIIVTGKRISDTKAALDACLARHCPANEDIDATLAHAEALFVLGRYRDARTTLLGSLRRNKPGVGPSAIFQPEVTRKAFA